MFYVYLFLSVALVPLLNNFYAILRESYSWWLVPLLVLAFFVGFIIIQLSIFFISVAVVDINKPAEKGAKYYRFIANLSLPLILKLARVKINLSGADKVPENGRMLFVCNHQHNYDPIIMLTAFPQAEIGFIGKKEIYTTMPFVAKIMHKLYCLPIDRENNREAVKTIISAVKILKENKASIGLFPEGYTSKNCEILPIRSGSLKIAYKANVPIVVCVINNTQSISKNMFKRRTDIEFRVLGVIQPSDFENLSTSELGDIIHNQMKDAISEIRK